MRRTNIRLPWVRKRVLKSGLVRWQACPSVDGVRRLGRLREHQELAHADAVQMRAGSVTAKPVGGQTTLGELAGVVEGEFRVKRSEGHVRFFRNHAAMLWKFWSEDTTADRVTAAGVEFFIQRRMRGWEDGEGENRRVWKPVSARTIHADLSALSAIMRLAIRLKQVKTNPVREVALPRLEQRKMDVFTGQEIADILARIRQQAQKLPEHGPLRTTRLAQAAIIEFLFLTGMRKGEVARLELDDLDRAACTIHVRGKVRPRTLAASERVIALWDQLAKARSAHREQLRAAGKLAHASRLIPNGDVWIRESLRRQAKALGDRRLHAHALRHSLATDLVERAELTTVQHVLGHRKIEMTARYVHARSSRIRVAMESVTLPAPSRAASGGGSRSKKPRA